MKQLAKKVKQISILILTIFLFGCTDDDTKYPKVVAGFTYTVNEATGTVTFINISDNSRKFLWIFGDGTSSTEINPIKTYAEGTYVITLKATNVAGGSDTFEDEITIIAPPVLCTPETAQSLAVANFNLTFQAEGTTTTIVDDGAVMVRVANPDFENELNKSCYVGKITRNPGFQFANNQFNFSAKFDFTTKSGFKIKVWSPAAGTKVTVKLEGTGATEKTVTTTAVSAWEELTFDFPAAESNKYNKIVLFFNLNSNTTGTFYIDDFRLYGTGSGGPGGGTFDDGLLTNGDFENGSSSWTIGVGTDPAPIKTVSGNTFYSVNVTAAGNSFDVNLSQKLAIVQGSTYTLTFDAWSDRARSIVAGIGLSGGAFTNTVQTVNITTTRTTYTLTLAATNFGANDARVLFDLGAAIGEVNIDNVSLFLKNGGGTGGTALFDFENGTNYFNAFEGATVANIANPKPTGNASSRVMELVKPSGVPFYAGINSDQTLSAPIIDMSKGRIFKIKIWSPKANSKIRMRFEQEPGVEQPPAFEIFQTVATANEWVTLIFDFTSQIQSTSTYTRLVLNTDWDAAGTGEKYYIDDITQE